MTSQPGTVHASAVLVGPRAILIRGPSGSGKSSLALALIETARPASFARLVADDRAHLEVAHGRLLVRPAEALAGLLEVRGVGLMRITHEPSAVVGLVVDLAAADAERLPGPSVRRIDIQGVALSRLAVASGSSALQPVLAFINSSSDGWL